MTRCMPNESNDTPEEVNAVEMRRLRAQIRSMLHEDTTETATSAAGARTPLPEAVGSYPEAIPDISPGIVPVVWPAVVLLRLGSHRMHRIR